MKKGLLLWGLAALSAGYAPLERNHFWGQFRLTFWGQTPYLQDTPWATDIQAVNGGARGCGTSSASRSPTQAHLAMLTKTNEICIF